jgi:hypothetical protein
MKKLLMISILSVASTFAYAQSTKIGYKVGANLNHVSTNDSDLKEELHGRPSIHFGIVADFEMSKKLSFQPQLLFSGRGAKLDHSGHEDIYAFNSFEIPLNFVYKTNETKGLFFGMGPSLGYNLNGKIKSGGHGHGDHESEDIAFGSAIGEIRRVDLSVNALLGYQISKKLFVSTNYNLGVSNWTNNISSTWRNNIAAVSIGYFFK